MNTQLYSLSKNFYTKTHNKGGGVGGQEGYRPLTYQICELGWLASHCVNLAHKHAVSLIHIKEDMYIQFPSELTNYTYNCYSNLC